MEWETFQGGFGGKMHSTEGDRDQRCSTKGKEKNGSEEDLMQFPLSK